MHAWLPSLLAVSLFAAPVSAAAEEAAPPAPPAATTAAEPLAECLEASKSGRKRAVDDEFCLLRYERIGPLSIGIGQKEVMSALSCPVTKGKDTFSEATGDYTQKWSFPDCGINIEMVSSGKGGAKVVATIVAFAPSAFATSTGIHIGSTEEEVLTAYGPFLDRGATRRGKTIVAGSIYGGLIISIAGGVVSEIFLGAAAE